MQEIEYEDGTKRKKFFESLFGALDDAKEEVKDKEESVKKVTVTKIIPSRKNK